MSLWSSITLDTSIIGSLALLIAGAIGTVVAKRTMKAAFMLLLAALSTAALIGLMGYGYLAAFYAVVYAGTTLALLAFVIMTLGDLYEETKGRSDLAVFSTAVAAIMGIPIIIYAAKHTVPSEQLIETKFGLASAAKFFTSCWFCAILTMITIAAVLVEAISVARRGG